MDPEPIKVLVADAPKVIITLGLTTSNCASRYFIQAAISLSSGGRFPGGLHLIMLQIYNSSALNPTDFNILSKSLPERPTKGRPCISSSSPGASPINIIGAVSGPLEMTTDLRVR